MVDMHVLHGEHKILHAQMRHDVLNLPKVSHIIPLSEMA